jgi:site-specific DNA-methyltransferase (adenine-specific)
LWCSTVPSAYYNPQFGHGLPYTGAARIGKKQATPNYGTYKAIREDNDGQRYPKQVLDFNVVGPGSLHPTQKPVALFEYLIRTYTNPGEIILDNCCGSGTTGVAAFNTGRNSIQFELSAEYCEIARRRLAEAATAKAA